MWNFKITHPSGLSLPKAILTLFQGKYIYKLHSCPSFHCCSSTQHNGVITHHGKVTNTQRQRKEDKPHVQKELKDYTN